MLYSVLHVCTSCRTAGSPREPRENRPGFKLYQELRTLLNQSPLKRQVEVLPAECLSLCPRPCGISLSSVGKWSYLFGDQKPRVCARDIMELVSLYLSTEDGLMPRQQRPNSLQTSVLGRVPPFAGKTDRYQQQISNLE